ncbi:hypothetical protein FVE85_1738 [Porphyridium purpureum]|uniref:BZIP domain-containing protein n=1 Tax=Porphyridium purpureum TaxID=35688 RepID=A0A5J4YY81_PORPP|nr:hypothetical protein FVE85_1738 [Porphyridium purpureum]|eukprot:POR0688..scf209_3
MSDPNFDFLQAFSDAQRDLQPSGSAWNSMAPQQYQNQHVQQVKHEASRRPSSHDQAGLPPMSAAQFQQLASSAQSRGGGTGTAAASGTKSKRADSDACTNQSGGSSGKGGSSSQKKNEMGVSPEELRAILIRDPAAAQQFNLDALMTTSRKRLPEEERRRRRTESNRLSAERSREKRRAQQKTLEVMFQSVREENRQLREMREREESNLEQLREILLQNPHTRYMFEARRSGQQ